MEFRERQQKQFAIRKPLFERTICAQCTSASVERVLNIGGYLLLLGHTDTIIDTSAQDVENCFHLAAIKKESKLFTG